jgi:transcriptional regulator NrdR family protein
MFCLNCFHKTTTVTNTRTRKDHPQTWRRRHCLRCGITFTTYERPSLSENKAIYFSIGKSERFNLGRLVLSIARAFSHSPNDAKNQSLFLAQTIEDTLSSQREVITREDIAAITHQILKRFDEAAAMQYAIQHNLITSTKRRGRPSLASPARLIDE